MQSSFGEFIKAKRQEAGLTQKQLARQLFVSESAVSKWEKDVSHPDISLLPKLSSILGVSEHEIITASIDEKSRMEKKQAKKWHALVLTWQLFFYISYAVAIIPCFICNLAIDGTLSWFWIVISALLLAFTFTNLPKLIRRNKLILLPTSQFIALVILLAVCCGYSGGNWFWVASVSVFIGLIPIFLPIYICRYSFFAKVKKCADFITLAVFFIGLNILLIIIDGYCISNGYSAQSWYFTIALPIVIAVYLAVNLVMAIRFIKINRLLKTGLICLASNLLIYIPPALIKVDNPILQAEINSANIFMANLSNWQPYQTLENNVHLITFVVLLAVSLVFIVCGIVKEKINKD